MVKHPPANAGDMGSILESGRSPGGGNGNPLEYFCLRILWIEEPGGLQAVGSQRFRHNQATKQQQQGRAGLATWVLTTGFAAFTEPGSACWKPESLGPRWVKAPAGPEICRTLGGPFLSLIHNSAPGWDALQAPFQPPRALLSFRHKLTSVITACDQTWLEPPGRGGIGSVTGTPVRAWRAEPLELHGPCRTC